MRLKAKVGEFQLLLDDSGVTERRILKFLNSGGGYFILGAILKQYFGFGHHEACLFPEFRLGNSYQVDALLAGRSSDGWKFVFVELEAPNGQITLADGGLGKAFRNGLQQVKDWNAWLEAHYAHLSETFDKYRQPDKPLPREFMELDKSRIDFAVVAGRRRDFLEKTYRIRRESSVLLLHYDHLVDAGTKLIGQSTY